MLNIYSQSTGERGELSCGWAFLKLSDDSGNPLSNRYKHISLPVGFVCCFFPFIYSPLAV